MADPTIHDMYVALGGDPDDTDPTMQDMLEAAVVLGDAADPAAAIATHEAAGNPHPTYETSAEAQGKVDAAVAALVNSAPAALNTLKELSDALGADANFATTITAALAGKQPLDSDLTAIAALATTSYGRSILILADAAALAATHTHTQLGLVG